MEEITTSFLSSCSEYMQSVGKIKRTLFHMKFCLSLYSMHTTLSEGIQICKPIADNVYKAYYISEGIQICKPNADNVYITLSIAS